MTEKRTIQLKINTNQTHCYNKFDNKNNNIAGDQKLITVVEFDNFNSASSSNSVDSYVT